MVESFTRGKDCYDTTAKTIKEYEEMVRNVSHPTIETPEMLETIRKDLYAVLSKVPNEVPGLLAALQAGKIDGSVYAGDCACLLGTLAKFRGCDHDEIPGLVPDPHRPAEEWFWHIRPGHRPTNNIYAALTAEWIELWLTCKEN